MHQHFGNSCRGSDPQDHVPASQTMAAECQSEVLNLRRVFKRAQGTNFLNFLLIPRIARLTSSEQNTVFAIYCHGTRGSIHLTQTEHSQAVYSTVPNLLLTSSPPEVTECVCILHESVHGNRRDLSQVFPGVTVPTSNSCQSWGYLGSVLFCFF